MELERMVTRMTEMHYKYTRDILSMMEQVTSVGEERVLEYLYRNQDSVPPGQLTEELQLSTGRIANILRQLEDKGYIERSRRNQDKRMVEVSLTETGRESAAARYQETIAAHRALLAQLGEKDGEEFLRLLEKVFQIGKAMLSGRQ